MYLAHVLYTVYRNMTVVTLYNKIYFILSDKKIQQKNVSLEKQPYICIVWPVSAIVQ